MRGAGRQLVLGVGNVMMCDDGIGPRLIEYFDEKCTEELDFELIDVGQDSFKLLHYCEEGLERMLVVDCARMGLAPGEHRIFSPDEVTTAKEVGGFSIHGGDVMNVIAMARTLGYHVPRMRILGIEPCSMAQGMELSAELSRGLVGYAQEIVKEMRAKW